jgi:hypothetical protein
MQPPPTILASAPAIARAQLGHEPAERGCGSKDSSRRVPAEAWVQKGLRQGHGFPAEFFRERALSCSVGTHGWHEPAISDLHGLEPPRRRHGQQAARGTRALDPSRAGPYAKVSTRARFDLWGGAS